VRFFRSLINPGGRLLARHLRRLCQSLQELGARLKEGVASAAGQTVAEAVRETVLGVLDEHGTVREEPFRSPGRPTSRDYLWDREEPLPQNNPWADELDAPSYNEELDCEPAVADADSSQKSSSWLYSLALGLQAASCWLRRRAGRHPLLTALGCGLGAALIASRCGLLALAAASLLSLAGILQTVPDALGI
jgi:hypothetical protein